MIVSAILSTALLAWFVFGVACGLLTWAVCTDWGSDRTRGAFTFAVLMAVFGPPVAFVVGVIALVRALVRMALGLVR